MKILVAVLTKTDVRLHSVKVPEGATADDALKAAGVMLSAKQTLAVWNERCDGSRILVDGDRLEVLPDLIVDPMTARRIREERHKNPKAIPTISGRNGSQHRLI